MALLVRAKAVLLSMRAPRLFPKPSSAGFRGMRLLKNVSVGVGARIVVQILAFFNVVYLARILSPDRFGELNLATAIVGYFGLVAAFGLPTIGSREVARNPEDTPVLAGQIVLLRCALAASSYVLLMVFVVLTPLSFEVKLLTLFLGVGVLTQPFVLDWVFIGLSKMEIAAAGVVVSSVIIVGLTLVVVRRADDVLWIPVTTLAGSLGATALLYRWLRRQFGIRWHINLSVAKSLMRVAAPITLSGLMIQSYVTGDTVLLGFFQGSYAVGLYNSAYKFILIANSLNALYVQALIPEVARIYAEDPTQVIRFVTRASYLGALLGVALVLLVTFNGHELMLRLFGSNYADSGALLKILVWSTAITLVSQNYANGLLACRYEKLFLWGVAIGAVFNIGLNLLLIPQFGAVAAAVTTVLTEFVVFIFMFLAARRYLTVQPAPSV